MTQRTTNTHLGAAFTSLVGLATGLGVDCTGWYFGQNVGLCYNIYDRANGKKISRDWLTKKEAWYGMQDMANALLLISKEE